MTRRILSLVIALVASVLGYFALWTGGTTLSQAAASFGASRGLDVGALALVALGVILLAFAALTVALSSLGVIVVGAVHLVVGLASILSPFELMRGGLPLTYQLINQLFGSKSPINYGFYTSVPTGVGLIVGIVLLSAGIAARGRSGHPSSTWRIIAPILAVILGLVGVLIVLVQGAVVYTSQLQRASWDGNIGVVGLLFLAVLLIGGVVFTVRWSSAGVLVLGAILTISGAIAIVQPNLAAAEAMAVSRELGMALALWSGNGSFLLIGVVVLAVGFGARTRGRRRLLTTVMAPAETPIAGPHGTVAT